MPKSSITFLEGEAIDLGSHGENDFVFEEGNPVVDGGVSTFAFEQGNGLLGEVVAYVNGTAYALRAVEGTATISDFYGYDGLVGSHGYWQFEEIILFPYHKTDTDDWYLVCAAGKPGDSGTGRESYSVDLDWDGSIGTYSVVDGETGSGGDRFREGSSEMGWPNNDNGADGFAVPLAESDGLTFTATNSTDHESVNQQGGLEDFGVITNGTTAPPGSEYEYAGMGGNIRIEASVV